MVTTISTRDAAQSSTTPTVADVVVLLGSRREAISLAALIRVMATSPRWNVMVHTTGDGLVPLARTLDSLDLVVTEDLDIERPGLSIEALLGRAVERTHALLVRRRPSTMIVEGESTTIVGASLAARHLGVMVAHVTATAIPSQSRDCGIATTNARLIAQLAQLHFVPSVRVSTSLRHHGVDPDGVIIVGTPARDNLRWILRNKPGRSQFCTARRKVLVVLRQSEDVTRSFDILTRATTRLARDADVEVVPLQHRLVVRSIIEGRLGSSPRVRLTGDLDDRDYVATLESADIVLADSSAVKCEAHTLHRPCVSIGDDFLDGLREDADDADLVNRVDEVFAASRKLLDDEDHYASAARHHDAGLGGIAANSMELRLRAAVATRAPRGRETRQSPHETNAEYHRGRVT